MPVRSWGESKNGLFEFVSISKETLEGGLNVMRRSFFVDEKACIGVELQRHPEAAKELEQLCVNAAEDGVSLVVIEKKTQVVVGVSFNKLQIRSSNEPTYFDQFAGSCKEESSKALVLFMNESDAVVDLFELTGADCLLELMFTAVLPEYRRKGISRRLFETAITIAEDLNAGRNVKSSLENSALLLEPVPTIVSGVMTGIATQDLAKSLGFVRVVEICYERFMFKGRTFASRIGPDTPFTTIDYFPVKKDVIFR